MGRPGTDLGGRTGPELASGAGHLDRSDAGYPFQRWRGHDGWTPTAQPASPLDLAYPGLIFLLCARYPRLRRERAGLKPSYRRARAGYFGGGSTRSWNLEKRASAASTRLLSLAFVFTA